MTPKTRPFYEREIELPSGGYVALAGTFNLLTLTNAERAFIAELVEVCEKHEALLIAGAAVLDCGCVLATVKPRRHPRQVVQPQKVRNK